MEKELKLSQPESVREAALWTVAWFDVFGQVLTLREVHRWLWGMNASLPRVHLALEECEHIRSEKHGGEIYYFLEGRENMVAKRLSRERVARRFWERVQKYGWVFRWVPHLRMVAVVNTLAFGYPDSDSDIDLLVMTKAGRIWSARACLTMVLNLLGVRRQGEKVAERFCLSFFISEEGVRMREVALKPFDPYLAQWMLTMVPVFDAENYTARLWGENLWVRGYFPNFVPGSLKAVPKRGRMASASVWLMEKILWNGLMERVLRAWLKPRAERKAARLEEGADIVISDEMLKFHNKDMRRKFLEGWRERIEKIDPVSANKLI